MMIILHFEKNSCDDIFRYPRRKIDIPGHEIIFTLTSMHNTSEILIVGWFI